MKIQVGATMLLAGVLLAGCGNGEQGQSNETKKVEQTTTAEVLNLIDGRLKEPAKDERCAFCHMKVYQKEHKFGGFAAQAIDESGNNLFFDDAGCMLNYEREHNVTLEKFVRDYDSKEWLKLDDAKIVQASIQTPMNYGFAYFKKEASAKQFMKNYDDAKLVAVAAIDDVATDKMNMKKHHE